MAKEQLWASSKLQVYSAVSRLPQFLHAWLYPLCMDNTWMMMLQSITVAPDYGAKPPRSRTAYAVHVPGRVVEWPWQAVRCPEACSPTSFPWANVACKDGIVAGILAGVAVLCQRPSLRSTAQLVRACDACKQSLAELQQSASTGPTSTLQCAAFLQACWTTCTLSDVQEYQRNRCGPIHQSVRS